ncbi:MAG: SH3 domain-containing protein [Chloroflexota bacterium]
MPVPTGTASPPTITPSPTSLDAPTATATKQPTVCTVTATALHIRQGAGVEYAVIGWLTRGESVSVQNQRGAWYDIGAGWIHSKYCEVKP